MSRLSAIFVYASRGLFFSENSVASVHLRKIEVSSLTLAFNIFSFFSLYLFSCSLLCTIEINSTILLLSLNKFHINQPRLGFIRVLQ